MGEVNTRQSNYQVSPNELIYFVKKGPEGVIHSSPSWAYGEHGQLFQLPQRYLGVLRGESNGRLLVDPFFLILPWEYASGSAAYVPGLNENVQGLAHHGMTNLKLEEIAEMAQGITGLQSRLVPALNEDMGTVLKFLDNKPKATEKVRENYESIINLIHKARFGQIVAQAVPGEHFYWTARDITDKSGPMLMHVKTELGLPDNYPVRHLGIYKGPANGTSLIIDSVVLLHLWDTTSTKEVELPEMKGLKVAGITQGPTIHLDVKNAIDIVFGDDAFSETGLAARLVPKLRAEMVRTLNFITNETFRQIVRDRYSRLIRAIDNAEFGPSPKIEPM